MCFGNLPYECADSLNEENEDLDKLRAEISAWKGMSEKDRIRPDLPERLYLSLERLLSPNPNLRPSAEEILQGLHGGVPGSEDGSAMVSRDTSFQYNKYSNFEKKRTSHSPPSPDQEVAGNTLGFRRISPVSDTPTAPSRSHSPKRQGYNTFNDTYKPSHSTSLPSRPSKLRGLRMSSEETTFTAADSNGLSAAPATALGSLVGGTLDSSLILRPRLDSPTTRRLSEIPRVLPLLTRRARVLAALRGPEFVHAIKFSIFITKAVSLLRPCSPLGPNPWVIYPLLGLAVFDFTGSVSINVLLL